MLAYLAWSIGNRYMGLLLGISDNFVVGGSFLMMP